LALQAAQLFIQSSVMMRRLSRLALNFPNGHHKALAQEHTHQNVQKTSQNRSRPSFSAKILAALKLLPTKSLVLALANMT
jgi:hypothetical protein